MLANKLESSAKAVEPAYIEDYVNVSLFTGNAANRTITTNTNLASGGLVVIKVRSTAGYNNNVFSTFRGANQKIAFDSTAAKSTITGTVTSFTTSGFTLGSASDTNANTQTIVALSFVKKAKLWTQVQYTGNGTSQSIAHDLGANVGCMFVKCTSVTNAWAVYHTSLGATYHGGMDQSNFTSSSTCWNSTTPTSTAFTVGANNLVNQSGQTYEAYLFAASNSGGFGENGNENAIACGTFSGSGVQTITTGFEPAIVFTKVATGSDTGSRGMGWQVFDNSRGMDIDNSGSVSKFWKISSTSAENSDQGAQLTATGFKYPQSSEAPTQVYIAIRRGPMRAPVIGLQVFRSALRAGNGVNDVKYNANFDADTLISFERFGLIGVSPTWFDRMRGGLSWRSSNAQAESNAVFQILGWDYANGIRIGEDSVYGGINYSGADYDYCFLKRYPKVFDVAPYYLTGTVSSRPHNLGVTPELVITKVRPVATSSIVYIPNTQLFGQTESTAAFSSFGANLPATSTTFTSPNTGSSASIAYLFATLAGVSKVGTYTGTGASQTINCGFTSQARFVMIKRISGGIGGYFCFDTARGFGSGLARYQLLNNNGPENQSTTYLEPHSTGFTLTATAAPELNASGSVFLFLAFS